MADGGRHVPAYRVGAPIIEDLAWLSRNMRPDEIEQYEAMTGHAFNSDVAARALAMMPGPQFVIVGCDNMPIIAGGFMPIRPGVAEGWMVGTMAGWAAHWPAITRITRRHIDAVLRTVHRVQLPALASRIKTHEWYERGLGMVSEGLQVGFCADGQDAVMFAKTRRAA